MHTKTEHDVNAIIQNIEFGINLDETRKSKEGTL